MNCFEYTPHTLKGGTKVERDDLFVSEAATYRYGGKTGILKEIGAKFLCLTSYYLKIVQFETLKLYKTQAHDTVMARVIK